MRGSTCRRYRPSERRSTRTVVRSRSSEWRSVGDASEIRTGLPLSMLRYSDCALAVTLVSKATADADASDRILELTVGMQSRVVYPARDARKGELHRSTFRSSALECRLSRPSR